MYYLFRILLALYIFTLFLISTIVLINTDIYLITAWAIYYDLTLASPILTMASIHLLRSAKNSGNKSRRAMSSETPCIFFISLFFSLIPTLMTACEQSHTRAVT